MVMRIRFRDGDWIWGRGLYLETGVGFGDGSRIRGWRSDSGTGIRFGDRDWIWGQGLYLEMGVRFGDGSRIWGWRFHKAALPPMGWAVGILFSFYVTPG